MSLKISDSRPPFTQQLLPAADGPPAASTNASLLPLIQHWLLTAMQSLRLTHRLLDDGRFRKLFQVGSPEHWRSRGDEEPMDYADDTEPGSAADMRRRHRKIAELLAQAKGNLAHGSVTYQHPVFRNVDMLGELLGLTETDRVVLCLMVILHGDRRFYLGIATLSITVATAQECVEIIADLTQTDRKQLRASFATDGVLRSTGLIKLGDGPHDLEDYLQLSEGLATLLFEPHASQTPLVRHFFTPRCPASLRADHFPHLAQELGVITGILRESMRQGLRGTNVLLYGPPGVGKTELATLVAHAVGAEVYEVAYADDDGDPLRGVERLRSYNLCQRLLSQRQSAVVLFDEIEDMLQDGVTPGKAWVNRALEENPVPSIWITNNVEALDPAYRRRFDYSVHMKTPPRVVRRQIALHHLQALTAPCHNDLDSDLDSDLHSQSTGEDWLDALAENPTLAPAQIERAAKVAQLVEVHTLAAGDLLPARACVDRVLQRSARLMGQAPARSSRTQATAYDMAYLHTDVPITQVVASLQHTPAGSFCFYGPPGSGKTALAQHIARQLELPVVLRRASDLLSKYVGGSEQQIAAMFEEARGEPCVLILDEADSFLQARSTAQHSWEITQVNELLTQMEAFDGLFICTTNLLEKLDPAALRRFDWKIAFYAMTAAQRWAFFLQEYHLLGGDIGNAQHLRAEVTQQLSGLTPGDVAPVARQFRQLQCIPTPQQWLERLRAELAIRQGGNAETAIHMGGQRGYLEPAALHSAYIPRAVKNDTSLAA